MSLRVLPEATDDMKDAARWYNRQQKGLGRDFTALVRAAFVTIEAMPRAFGFARPPVAGREGRLYNLPRFPYAIYYEIRPDEILVLAVEHARRNPGGWHSRLP